MDWSFVGRPEFVAPVAGLVGVLIGSGISALTTRSIHHERLAGDQNLAERKFEFDKELAERRFKYDRELHDHKRRVELAEELVAGFHQFRHVIQAIRSRHAYPDEGAGRPRGEYETDEQARHRDRHYVPLARWKNNSEFISGLMSKRYRARTLFEADIDQAFQELHEVLATIQSAAGTLIGMSDFSDPARNDDIWEECERDIGWVQTREDHLDQKVCQAIKTVEAVCRPILEA